MTLKIDEAREILSKEAEAIRARVKALGLTNRELVKASDNAIGESHWAGFLAGRHSLGPARLLIARSVADNHGS